MIQRIAAVGIGSFALVALVTPLAGRIARRTGLIDEPKPNRAHDKPTPYLGGVAIMAGILGVLALSRTLVEPGLGGQLLVIALSSATLGLIGLLDDWRPNLPRWRLAAELLAAFAVIAAGIQLQVTPWTWANAAITVVWIVGITNAVNLLDNMDGLASGAVAIAGLGTAFLAASYGQQLVSVLAIAIAGASLGFLLHNRPPARIFMGDAGALPLGFLIAVTVAKLDMLSQPGPKRLAIVVLLCGVGIMDTSLVVVSRISRGISPLTGGTDHSSHRLVRAGLTRGRAVLVLHLLGAWFVSTALVVHAAGTALAVAGVAVTGVGVGYLSWRLLAISPDGPLDKQRVAPIGVEP